MVHARQHARAVSRACATAARTAKSFRALHVVVVVSLFVLLGRCVVQRSTERRLFLCVSVASHLPARIPIAGLIYAMGSVALSASDRRSPDFHFGHSRLASCAWRLSSVVRRQREKVMFFYLATSRLLLFLIPLAVPSFPRQPGSVSRSPGSIRGLGIFVEFALLFAAGGRRSLQASKEQRTRTRIDVNTIFIFVLKYRR